MTKQIGGLGVLGIGFETAYGTAVPPTKFIPIRSESLEKQEARQYRMNIRALADRQNPIQGYTHIEGDITFEVTHDSLLYALYLARVTPARTGAGPYTYTFTPANVTVPTTGAGATTRKTATIYVLRADTVFAYTGCSVSSLRFTVEDSILMCTANILGIDEEDDATTAPTWPTSQPYSAGRVNIQWGAPTAAAERTDIDSITLEINDNGQAENRIKSGTGPAFIRWGEREVSGSFDQDFEDKTEYDKFISQTVQELILKGSLDAADDEVQIKINAAALDSFPVSLPALGDLVRASTNFHGYYDTTYNPVYTITVKSTEDIS